MDVRVLPIKISADGSFSLLVVNAPDSNECGLLAFESDQKPDTATVQSNLPAELVVGNKADLVTKFVPSTSGNAGTFIVVGNESVFSAQAPTSSSRWVEQKKIKGGVLPEGVEDAKTLTEFYTGTLSYEALVAVVTSVHALRAVRAKVDVDSEALNIKDLSALRLIAQQPDLVGRLLSADRDLSFPLLAQAKPTSGAFSGLKAVLRRDTSNVSGPKAWRTYKSIFDEISAEALARAAMSQTATGLDVDAAAAKVIDDAAARASKTKLAQNARSSGAAPKPA
jgi:hypothetical protein